MEDKLFEDFLAEWELKQAAILADLEYQTNLADHLVTTELMYWKLDGYSLAGLISKENVQRWQLLGFSILSLQHRIYNFIPDFPSRQRPQLLALSKEVLKEQRFHNDAILEREETLSEEAYLEKVKSYYILVEDAVITPDKTLKVVLKNPQENTIFSTAAKYARDIDAHNVPLKKLEFYDVKTYRVTKDFSGAVLLVRPL